MNDTKETVEKALQLAMEVRISAGSMRTDHRRGNLARLRRARKAAVKLTRLAADLGATAFQAVDLLDAEVRSTRYANEQ